MFKIIDEDPTNIVVIDKAGHIFFMNGSAQKSIMKNKLGAIPKNFKACIHKSGMA